MVQKTVLKLVSGMIIMLLLTQCQTKPKGSFTVTVKYTNLDKMVSFADSMPPGGKQPAMQPPRIVLEEIPYGGEMNPIILDTDTLTKNSGEVVLKGTGKEEGIYQVAIDEGPFLLLINDANQVIVNIDLSKRENYYTVSGSASSEQLKGFIGQYSEKTFAVNKAFAALDSIKQLAGSDSMMILATDRKNKALNSLNGYLQDYITRSDHPALSLFALGLSLRSLPQADFEKMLARVVNKFPDHEALKKLRTTYDLQKAQMASQQQKTATDSWIGKPAPELLLPDTEGKLISTGAFRGKYVLVDFWASWCGPCRQENPNVVKAFNAYKDKNFTVLGVSLDKEKAPWLQAIKDDHLAWTHISDLKFWSSKAVDLYHFDGIPFNILIDPKGTIIAENLRGFDLEKKLQEVLK